MESENRFCVACGAMLPDGAEFCPSCGANVRNGGNPHISGPQPQYVRTGTWNSGKPKMTVLILAYGILATLMGLLFLVMGSSITEELYQEILSMGFPYDMTMDQFVQLVLITGAVFLVSGLLALASYVFCNKKGPKKYAVTLCLLASLVPLGTLAVQDVTGIFLFIIGALVTFMLYNDRNGFES